MQKKLTFFILSNSGAPIRQTTISKGAILVIGLLFLTAVASISYVCYDYLTLRQTHQNTLELQATLKRQTVEIADQRRQIQNFAEEINTLKSSIVELNDLERKIRVIANLEMTTENDGVFGVGGSIPEDLDTQIPSSGKHNTLLREMHDYLDDLKLASVGQKEGFETLLEHLKDQRNLLASTPAIRPTTGWITSKFGYRTSPFTGRREFHKGLDIATRKGTTVVAPADGVVTYAKRKGFLGNVISIDHGHGMVTMYGHLSEFEVKPGETVKRGQVIAKVGNTGRSTGPHLHYAVLLNGVTVDPAKYILN